MNDGRPVTTLAFQEPKHIVGVAAVHHSSHEIVLAWNGNRSEIGRLLNSFIEIMAQGAGHNLVGIDHQHPRIFCPVDGKLAGRFNNAVFAFGEGDNLATVGMRDVERAIGALHVADEHLVKAFHRFKTGIQVSFRFGVSV